MLGNDGISYEFYSIVFDEIESDHAKQFIELWKIMKHRKKNGGLIIIPKRATNIENI